MDTKGIYKIKCDGCQKIKIVTLSLKHTAPNFCSILCKKSSKQGKAKLLPLPCPRPNKKVWENNTTDSLRAHRQAEKIRINWKPEDNCIVKVYLCRCNKIHIGNFPYTFMGYKKD